MSHLCYRCGAKGSFRVAEARLFREFGYDIDKDFPFRPTRSQTIRLCKNCNQGRKGGCALMSRPLYHPIDEALKNA